MEPRGLGLMTSIDFAAGVAEDSNDTAAAAQSRRMALVERALTVLFAATTVTLIAFYAVLISL